MRRRFSLRSSTALSAFLLVAAGLAVYANSFNGPFIFDDVPSIPDNPHIRSLWPIGDAMTAPSQTSLDGRPVAAFSFALNYAVGGLRVWTYHAFNFTLHLLAGFLLFGILRRTFAGHRLKERYGATAHWLALAIALVWVVHPLASETVDYIVQRTELLMGLFFLLTLYCAIRGAETPRGRGWEIASVAASALGMASKEVMVSAPLIVLLYDRTFLFKSFREAIWRRWKLYLGLASTWLILAALMAPAPRSQSVGVRFSQLTPWQYLLTQNNVILHYLRLSFWPHPLVLDYHDWPIAQTTADVVPGLFILLGLLGATAWALRRNSPAAFPAALFFLILAPTSSFVPIITEVAAERRMYLPLAGILALILVSGWHLLHRLSVSKPARRWISGGVIISLVIGLGLGTIRRNWDYRSDLAIWSDTVAKHPGNSRAHNNLGLSLVNEGQVENGIAHYTEALRLSPDYVDAFINLGAALAATGRYDEAIQKYTAALALKPDDARAHTNLGNALSHQGRMKEALEHHAQALRFKPGSPEVHNNFGAALMEQGRSDEAIFQYAETLRLKPEFPEAHSNLGIVYTSQGKFDEAISHFQQALRLKPNNAKTHNNFGNTLIHLGRLDEATAHYQEALRLKPDSAQMHNNLGMVLERAGRLKEAAAQYKEALRLSPDYAEARQNLESAAAQ